MINELLLNVDNITYVRAIKSVDKRSVNNTSFLKNKSNLEVSQINKKLPNIYWTSKLHKNPIKAGFIIAARVCSVKTLVKEL